jgi:hypothetical protein
VKPFSLHNKSFTLSNAVLNETQLMKCTHSKKLKLLAQRAEIKQATGTSYSASITLTLK